MNNLTKLIPQLLSPKKVVITMHQTPDLDAMGSSLALYHFLQQLGHSVTLVSPTDWPQLLNWMPACNQVLNFENQNQKQEITTAIQNAEWLFCLDLNNTNRLKKLQSLIKSTSCHRILIDHHRQPEVEFFDYGISNTNKSSTCEMIYDLIIESGHEDKINNPIMETLYAGIIGDTGSFRYPNTTSSTHKMAAHLIALGLNHANIHNNIFNNQPEHQLRFLGHALYNRMQIFPQQNTALISISKHDLNKYNIKADGTVDLANYPLSIQGIKLAAICIEGEHTIYWRFRSNGKFDVNTFARTYFQGGGHTNAAGGKSTTPMDDAIEYFIEAIKQNTSKLQ